MIEEVFELIEDFFDGKCSVSDFKTDIGVIADMEYDALVEENEDIARLIMEDLLDACNEHENGDCVMSFMERLNEIYEKMREKDL